MWCCKRLDASDWPVTTIVRGNISCLHVAAVAGCLSYVPDASQLFSRLLVFLSLFLFLSFSRTLLQLPSAVLLLHRFFAAPREIR